MLRLIERYLGNISLRRKILTLSGLFILGIFVVALVGGGVIYYQGKMVQEAVKSSQMRITTASSARIAIVEMNAAINGLLAADEKSSIRPAAIASIRASSLLDEHIQHLQEALPDSSKVSRLAELLQQVKPVQMAIIGAGKRNKDAQGLEKLNSISSVRNEIETISQDLVNEEREGLLSQLASMEQEGEQAILALGGFVLMGILVGVLVSLFAAHMLTKPLAGIEKTMAAVASGDLNISLTSGGKDEVGRTVQAISSTVETLNRIIQGIMNSSTVLSGEAQSLTQAADAIHNVTKQQHDSVKLIKEESESVLSATSNAMTRLDDASGQARDAADSATSCSDEIKSVVHDFRRFQGDMEQTAQDTHELARAAEQITMITNTIRGISEQTNLLALNAAIEAARAGEQGRGFAVVADEVRGLAQRTNDATDEISILIDRMSSSVKVAVESLESTVKDSRSNIERLHEVAEQTSDNSEQSRLTQAGMKEAVEIMASQVNTVQGIANAVGALFSLAEKSSQQADSLSHLSNNLNGEASGMQEMVKHFKVSS